MVLKRIKMKLKWPHPKAYTEAMEEHLDEDDSVESPMDLYQWFISHWSRPLNDEKRRQAYLAAWAVAIDKGIVDL